MKKYIVRSLKYFFALCVLCIALMGLMLMTGTSALSLDDTLYAMFHTDRYLMLFTAIVVLAALYPRFGFVERKVEGDVEENGQWIVLDGIRRGVARVQYRLDSYIHMTRND